MKKLLRPGGGILGSNFHNMDQVTVILGDDEALWKRLREVLRQCGATQARPKEWGVGGSQEIETWYLLIDGQELTVESETYIGLSITGPAELVKRIQGLLGEGSVGPHPCRV